MQTFLPFASFRRSARVLDTRRLGKQRVETLQILRAVSFDDYGWQSHPVVVMWRGYADALVAYGLEITREWMRRGHGDQCTAQIVEFATGGRAVSQTELRRRRALPPWLGWEPLHRSHRSALVRKDPAFYAPLFEPELPADLPYVWPSIDALERRPEERFAAWVVRAGSSDELARFLAEGIVALPALEERSTRANTKGARQVRAFLSEPRAGDAVIALAEARTDTRLHVGELVGGYRRDARSSSPHVRAVRWLGTLERSALDRPARLQDPRLFFALRGERDPRVR